MLKLDDRLSPASLASQGVLALRRHAKPLATAAAALLLLWLLAAHHHSNHARHGASRFWSTAPSSHAHPYAREAELFWEDVAAALTKRKPSLEEIPIRGSVGWLSFDAEAAPPERPDKLELGDEQLQELKRQHRGAVADMAALAPRLPFVKGTRGVVTAANNDALTILAASLRMLRKAGSQLPVEIMIDDYEAAPCQSVFPALGARCVFVEEFVGGGALPEPFRFSHFSWKAAVVAFSSFEQVLFMDADLFPVDRPDELFRQKPFVNRGYVLWPDYWRSSASHHLYAVLGLDVPGMGERASTESGALMIDKSTHARAVLQSLYYNTYGPKHFYPLFSQGATGFGDKETWLAAAQVHGLPWYQVSEGPARLGYTCDGKDRPIASAQHHPGDDYAVTTAGGQAVSRTFMFAAPRPRVLFVHGNLPKYDGPAMLDWDMPELGWRDMLRCGQNHGEAHRLWGSKEMTVARFGWDVEKSLWDSMRWVACEHGTAFSMWTNGTWHSQPRRHACEDLTRFYKELMPNETYDAGLEAAADRRAPSAGWSYWPRR